MSERHITDQDIKNCGRTGVVLEEVGGKICVRGKDMDGQKLNLICVYDGDLLIVTVF
jgi:hypothetical protein